MVIYCQTTNAVTMVYAHFEAELGAMMYKDGSGNTKERLVEMFHAHSDELYKNHILDSFGNEDGYVRVVIVSIAYGMGVDCNGVKTVIHYGPSRNLETYMQESGRAGRGHNNPCTAIILYKNLMLKHCSYDIVNYIRNQAQCRRKVLLSHFDVDSDNIIRPKHLHLCCDICQKKCNCSGRQCDFSFFYYSHAIGIAQRRHAEYKMQDCLIVSRSQVLCLNLIIWKSLILVVLMISKGCHTLLYWHQQIYYVDLLICKEAKLLNTVRNYSVCKTFILMLMFGSHALQVIFCL